ncbi:MAG: ATP-binding protein [Bacteroidales bacterium]|nr:ATP-binding protein [Bacteroidales bacterium]
MIKRYIYLFILTLFLNPSLSGQDEYVRFKRITINEGLSLSSVYNIYQDSKGFMWFGTEDGLNKYDGQNITVYGATTDQHHILANKWIELVYEDKSGMIWLGSRGGLTKYNPRRGVFSTIQHDPSSPNSLSNDTVTVIAADIRNDVWVGTFQGLNRVDRFTNDVERIIPDEEELAGLTSRITGFIQDRSGTFWIGTYQGLYSYDSKSNLFFNETADGSLDNDIRIYCMSDGEDALWLGTNKGLVQLDLSGDRQHHQFPMEFSDPESEMSSILVDRLNQVWIQTGDGLYCYKLQENDIQKVIGTGGVTHSLALNPVEPLVEDRNGFIWYGSFNDGVFKIDPQTLNYKHLIHNPADPQSLAENSINCIFEDRSGTMWFGSFGAGISIMDPQANIFTLFKNNPFNSNSLASSFIWTIFEASDSTIWIGSNAHGISCYNPRHGTFTHINHNPVDPTSLSNSSVRKIYQDSKERIWIGTDGGGLNLYNHKDRSFTHFVHDPADPTSISDNSVRAIYEDRHGEIWVGTRNGLNLLETDQNSFRRFLTDAADDNSPPHNFIYSAIYQDREDNLWIGTYGGGLCKMDPEDGSCISYNHDPEDPTTISDNIVFSIHEDEMGRFWIGTNSGLNMFYPATESFRRFGVSEGLANEVIYGVLPDDDNWIWLSTNLGIIRFNLETFQVKNYDMNDGLQSNEFNGGAYHRGGDGRLYFGGVYGLNVIDPSSIEPSSNVTEVTLTKLEVLGKDVLIAGVDLEEAFEEDPNRIIEFEGEYYSSENITYMEEIVLDYNHRFFSIEFSALNNLQQGKLQYSYIMENLETEWNNVGSRNYVSYANMKTGSYLLKVVAENTDGFRSDPPLQLRIVVTPPFWRSWWFILLEAMVASAIAVMIYIYLVKSRTNRLLKYQNHQISLTNEALRESEKNLMELNATKDKFFSIISHDLKNPFSSLLSISELMVDSFDDADTDDHRAGFRKINQSVRHLLSLLENLLTWSSSQRGKIKCDPVRFNLSNLIQENINLHKLPAEKKGIELFSPTEDAVYAHGDRDMINSVIRNLMTNAVKFTDRDKKVEVKVLKKEKNIEVCIVDEGIGITKENLRKLFRIDEKFKSTGTAGEKGTGLGLIICREFIEKNGGEITVQSKPGEGTTFRFTIPMSN